MMKTRMNLIIKKVLGLDLRGVETFLNINE